MQRSLSYFAWAAACAGLPLTLAAQPVPNPDLDLVHLVLNRVAFGPTPELTTRFLNTSSGTTVRQNLEAYIDQQMNLTVDPNDPDYADLLTASGSVQVQNLLLQQTGLPWLYPANQTSQATDAEIGNVLVHPTNCISARSRHFFEVAASGGHVSVLGAAFQHALGREFILVLQQESRTRLSIEPKRTLGTTNGEPTTSIERTG